MNFRIRREACIELGLQSRVESREQAFTRCAEAAGTSNSQYRVTSAQDRQSPAARLLVRLTASGGASQEPLTAPRRGLFLLSRPRPKTPLVGQYRGHPPAAHSPSRPATSQQRLYFRRGRRIGFSVIASNCTFASKHERSNDFPDKAGHLLCYATFALQYIGNTVAYPPAPLLFPTQR